jgi:hypothetical protein
MTVLLLAAATFAPCMLGTLHAAAIQIRGDVCCSLQAFKARLVEGRQQLPCWTPSLKACCAQITALSFTSLLVARIHRQLHRPSIVDPLNVTTANIWFLLCVFNAKCDTRSAIVVSTQSPRGAILIDPLNQPQVHDSSASSVGDETGALLTTLLVVELLVTSRLLLACT